MTYNLLSWVDDHSAILLDCGLDDVRRKAISQKVHQGVGSVGCREVIPGSFVGLIRRSLNVSRSDGDNQHDAQYDGKSGG